MAKAIHWPAPYLEAVRTEDPTREYCALRPGTLYFEHQFWVPGEEVDLRVDHQPVRRARIARELLCVPLQDLPAEVYAALKPGLQSQAAVSAYLAETYQQEVTPESLVTVVFYQPL